MERQIERPGQRAWRWLRGAEPLLVAVTLAAWAARQIGLFDSGSQLLDVLTLTALAALALIWSIRLVQWGRAFLQEPRRVLLIVASLLLTIFSPPVLLFSLARLGRRAAGAPAPPWPPAHAGHLPPAGTLPASSDWVLDGLQRRGHARDLALLGARRSTLRL